jgi:hypothetical protein
MTRSANFSLTHRLTAPRGRPEAKPLASITSIKKASWTTLIGVSCHSQIYLLIAIQESNMVRTLPRTQLISPCKTKVRS